MAINDKFDGLDEFFEYKNRLMRDILTNKEIVRLLNHANLAIDPEDLAYSCVFPFEYVPDTTENETTFICFDVDITSAPDNTYLFPTIYIWVFTHDDLVRLPEGGIRTDKLASEISKTINGSREYGLGRLRLEMCKRFSPISNYQGRVLRFVAVDWNRPTTGKGYQSLPANRRGI